MDRRSAGLTVRRAPVDRPRWLAPLLAALPVAFLAVFFAWPILDLAATTITGSAIGDTFTRVDTWNVLWFSTWMAALSTVCTVIVALPATYVVARFDFRARPWLIGVLTAVFVLPTVVMGAAFLAALPARLDRTIWAVIAAHVAFNLAVVVRTVGATWEVIPVDVEHAAATLGASRWQVHRHVVLPLSTAAIAAAAAIVFAFCFTSFGIVGILAAPGTRTVESEIWRRATQLGDIGGAAVLAAIQLVLLGVVVVAAAAVSGRTKRSFGAHPPRRRRPGYPHDRRVVRVVTVSTLAIALVPLGAMAAQSFATREGWSTRAWRELGRTEVRPGVSLGIDPAAAIQASLTTAAWATGIAVVLGGLASLAIESARRSGRLLDVGAALPLATSAVTIGFGIIITFDADPVDWRSSWWLVPVGQAMIALPFVVRTVNGVLAAIPPDLSWAAATLGATPLRAWRRVVVAQMWRPLAVGGGLAAAISIGEFGATSVLSRQGAETLPIAIERLLGRAGPLAQAQGYALATILAVVTLTLATVAVVATARSERS